MEIICCHIVFCEDTLGACKATFCKFAWSFRKTHHHFSFQSVGEVSAQGAEIEKSFFSGSGSPGVMFGT